MKVLMHHSQRAARSFVRGLEIRLKPVFHLNRIVTYRSIFFCVEVISSTLVVRKQINTLRYDTVEVRLAQVAR
jgi:hypothetical protein